MERGHTAKNSTSNKDRSSRCYNCGEEGHKAKECTASSKCPVCSDGGKPANHRFGGKACDPEVAAQEGHPPETDEAASRKTEDQATAGQTSQECGHEEAMETAE